MLLASLVFDHRGQWQTRISEHMGMPFSRFRALRRLEDGPLTGKELAERLEVDAGASSNAVSDLVDHGLVSKREHPEDGRRKILALTDSGRAMLDSLRLMDQPAELFAALDDDDRRTLLRILTTMKESTR